MIILDFIYLMAVPVTGMAMGNLWHTEKAFENGMGGQQGVLFSNSDVEALLVNTDNIMNGIALTRKPTCVRKAVAELGETCQTLDADLNEYLKTMFAVQLTICELEVAHNVPEECQKVFSREHGNSEFLESCVASLESRPQWWTSFSGNYRDASKLCKTARVEIEKDQLIELTNNITKLQSMLFSALYTSFTQNSQNFEMQNSRQRDISSELESIQLLVSRLNIELRTNKAVLDETLRKGQDIAYASNSLLEDSLKSFSQKIITIMDHFNDSINAVHKAQTSRIESIEIGLRKLTSSFNEGISEASFQFRGLYTDVCFFNIHVRDQCLS